MAQLPGDATKQESPDNTGIQTGIQKQESPDNTIGQVFKLASSEDRRRSPPSSPPKSPTRSGSPTRSPIREKSKESGRQTSPEGSPKHGISKDPSKDDEIKSLTSERSGLTVVSLRSDGEVMARQITPEGIVGGDGPQFGYEGPQFKDGEMFSHGGLVRQTTPEAFACLSDLYTLQEQLGTGAYGTVYLAIHNQTSKQIAVKKQPLQYSLFIQNEFFIAKKLKHPNIVMIHDMVSDDDFCYLVMDICTGGDLYEYWDGRWEWIANDQKYFYCFPPTQLLARYLWQMLQALRYLHHHRIVHGDIKLSNILLDGPAEKANLKLIDFGTSKRITEGCVFQSVSGAVTTCGYVAPEVLSGTGYDEMSDVWSIGVCAFILFDGDQPIRFTDENDQMTEEQLHKITMEADISYKKILGSYPKAAVEVLKLLLEKDPHTRSSAKDVLSLNAWLRKEGRATKSGRCSCGIS